MDLSDIRKDIDAIDEQMIELLTKRMECSLKVAEIKRAEGLPVYHPGREQAIFDKVKEKGGVYGDYFVELYRLLMECSRALQHENLTVDANNELIKSICNAPKNLNISGKVACYGQVGAFTHIALTSAFNNGVEPIFCNTFEKVFAAVNSGEYEFGFVPVENSSAGSVDEVYDLILKYKLYIVGAVAMPITHNLLGIEGAELSDITAVYSHPQALSQCKAYLTEKGIKPFEYSNTAAAAKMVKEKKDKSVGAIGSLTSAAENGLKVLAPSIQSFANNQTRFIAISKHPVIPSDSNKISVVFTLSHTAGSLQKILTRFSLHGLNLTKLESRPGKNGDFETQFYLDFLGNVEDNKTLSLLSALYTELNEFSFLGNYKEFTL